MSTTPRITPPTPKTTPSTPSGSYNADSIREGNNVPSISLVPRGSLGSSEVFTKLPLLAPTGGKRIVWKKDHFMHCFTRYQELVNLIVNNLGVVKAIAEATDPTEHDCFSKVVVNILHKADRVLPLLCHLIHDEIIGSKTVTVKASVLRGTSILTQIEKAFVRIAGKDYLWSIFGDVITSIIGDPELDLEIDPAKIENKNILPLFDKSVEGLIAERAHKIEDIVRTLVTRITDAGSIQKMPIGIRAALAYISAVSRVHTPDLTTQLISGFVILRMFNPAIVTPEATGMIPRDFPPSMKAHRNLVLIAKVFQNIANNGGVASGKERFMEVMRSFVEAMAPQMQRYFECLAAPLDPADPVAQLLQDTNPETLPDTTVDVRELNINDLFELHRILDRAAPKLLLKFKGVQPLFKGTAARPASASIPVTVVSTGGLATSLASAAQLSSPTATAPVSLGSARPTPRSATGSVSASGGRPAHSNSVTAAVGGPGSGGFVTAAPRKSTGFLRAAPDTTGRSGSITGGQSPSGGMTLSTSASAASSSSASISVAGSGQTLSTSAGGSAGSVPLVGSPKGQGSFLCAGRPGQPPAQRHMFLDKDSPRRNSVNAEAAPTIPIAVTQAHSQAQLQAQGPQEEVSPRNKAIPSPHSSPLSVPQASPLTSSSGGGSSPAGTAAAAAGAAGGSGWVATSTRSVRWKKQIFDLIEQLGPPPSYSLASEGRKDETQAASTTAAAAAAAQAASEGGVVEVSDVAALEKAKFLYQGASSVDGTPVFYLIFNRVSMSFLGNVNPLISHVYKVMGHVVDKGPYILVIDMSWCSLSNDEKRIIYSSLKTLWSLLNRNYKKNIEKIFIVHPNQFIHTLIFFAKTFVSRKFWRKVTELYNWKQLPGLLGLKPDLVTLPESSKNTMAKSYTLIKVNSRGKRQERAIKFTLDSILNIDPKTNKIKNEKRLDQIEEVMTDAGSVELWMRFSEDPAETKRLFAAQTDLGTRIYICNSLKERDAILRDIFSGGFKLGQGATRQEFSVVKINKAGKRQERKFKITVDSLMNVAGGDIRHEISFAGIEDVKYDPAEPDAVLVKYKAEKEWRKAICKDAEELYNSIKEGIRHYASFGEV